MDGPKFYGNEREGNAADAMPWPFNKASFKTFAVKTYPNASDAEHDMIADAIFKWFYNSEWGG